MGRNNISGLFEELSPIYEKIEWLDYDNYTKVVAIQVPSSITRNGRVHVFDPLLFIVGEGFIEIRRDGYEHDTHPHVSGGKFCAGAGWQTLQRRLGEEDWTGFLAQAVTMARTYTPADSYSCLEPCDHCGRYDWEIICENCESKVCIHCTSGSGRCSDCSSQCNCGEFVDRDDITACMNCSRYTCPSCQNHVVNDRGREGYICNGCMGRGRLVTEVILMKVDYHEA